MSTKISIVLKSFEIPKSDPRAAGQSVFQSAHSTPYPLGEGEAETVYSSLDSQSNPRKQIPLAPRALLADHSSQIRLPKKRTLYTVLRSPHIDKKSRDQFEMRTHTQLIQISTRQLRDKLSVLKAHNLSGVQLKVTFDYKTRLLGCELV